MCCLLRRKIGVYTSDYAAKMLAIEMLSLEKKKKKMLNDYFFEAIKGKTDIAPVSCPLCRMALSVHRFAGNQSQGIACQACSVSFDLRRIDHTIRYLPRKGRIETLYRFRHLIENNAIEIPPCPKCGRDIRWREKRSVCCGVRWGLGIQDDGRIGYEVASVSSTHEFLNPIHWMSRDDYTYYLAMFAAEHVHLSSETAGSQLVAPAPVATSTLTSPTHKDVAGQILNHLWEHGHIAKTREMINAIGCSEEGFNKAITKLITEGKVEKIARGVYKLIDT